MTDAKERKSTESATANVDSAADGDDTQESTAGIRRFLQPGSPVWRDLELTIPKDADDDEKERLGSEVSGAKDALRETLLVALQMPHLVVLTGSGTSVGDPGGPSMWNLWDHCVLKNPGTNRQGFERTDEADTVIKKIGYDEHDQNIEALLSRCDAFLSINEDPDVSRFAECCKETILRECSSFLADADTGGLEDGKLDGHGMFLHRLSRRRIRDPRLKIFTTNYDVCFEKAASINRLVVIDGFSFAQPRLFSPSYFEYDVVRRSLLSSEIGDPLEGVFQLLKLHGSVDWEREESGEVRQTQSPDPKKACLIYPARGKFQQSYLQPHLELMSQYLTALRQPNTCLIVVGFGFNDDHLSEPILSAALSNPQLRIIVADFRAEDYLAGRDESASPYWKRLAALSNQGENIWFVNAAFRGFASLIPDLKALTPAQQLEKAIKRAGR